MPTCGSPTACSKPAGCVQWPEYVALGQNMLWRSAAQSLRKLPGLGLMLLPGDIGAIVERGLVRGEDIVVEGYHKLQHGMKVEPVAPRRDEEAEKQQ